MNKVSKAYTYCTVAPTKYNHVSRTHWTREEEAGLSVSGDTGPIDEGKTGYRNMIEAFRAVAGGY